jgi:hypothetical protein
MSLNEVKLIYDSLLESGDLKFFHPGLVGEWAIDEKKFTSLYNATESLLGGIDDDDSDIDFGDYDYL